MGSQIYIEISTKLSLQADIYEKKIQSKFQNAWVVFIEIIEVN